MLSNALWMLGVVLTTSGLLYYAGDCYDWSFVDSNPLKVLTLGGFVGGALSVGRVDTKVLGPGFAESVYEEALAVELNRREIPFERQVPLTVKYKGFCVGEGRADLLVGGELIIELKSVEQLAAVRVAQAHLVPEGIRPTSRIAHHFQRRASQEWHPPRRE